MSKKHQFSFNISKRIHLSSEYQVIFKSPDIRIRTNNILLLAKKNKFCYCRLGVVVGKKHLKRAVDRNYCKRVIRESFRLNQPDLPNYDIIILALGGIQHVFKTELVDFLRVTWGKLNERVKT